MNYDAHGKDHIIKEMDSHVNIGNLKWGRK